MFKKTRVSIVATIMSVLIFLWMGTIGIIYVSSYLDMTKQNREMLKTHAEMYSLSRNSSIPPALPSQEPGGPRGFGASSPIFQLSTFYSVALTYDLEAIEITNSRPMLHTDSELEELSIKIADNDRQYGTENDLAFYITDKGGYLLVVFMDNAVLNKSASTLIRYTVIFGALAMVAFFFLSVFLAKRIIAPLEDSYRKQKQFISDAGHELKTPISIVSTNAELLSRNVGSSRWLDNIQYEVGRMGMLVSQLLELARTESVTPVMERFDLSRLCNGEALPFESIAFEHGFSLHCEIADNIFTLGNSAQLKQLVSILLDNAIRHSSGGDVCLKLQRERAHIRLSVINSGEPIPPEIRSQIFERFFRANEARNGEDKHYGLGLAIAKAIVSSHNGHIEVLCYDGLIEFRVRLASI